MTLVATRARYGGAEVASTTTVATLPVQTATYGGGTLPRAWTNVSITPSYDDETAEILRDGRLMTAIRTHDVAKKFGIDRNLSTDEVRKALGLK